MIDLCVVSYNTKPQLKRLFETINSDLADVDKKPWRLRVQDNGSEDDSADMCLDDFEYYHLSAFVGSDNVGYAQACNDLAAMGKSDIIGLLNSDVWFTTRDIITIEKSFKDNPDAAIVGPKQRDENGYITHAGIEGTNTHPRHRGWKVHDPSDILYRDHKEMVTVSGSAYFIRRKVWEELTQDEDYIQICKELYGKAPTGAFLPTSHYYEETWNSYFARHKGYKIFYDGRISIGHSWHASHEVGSPQDKMFKKSQTEFRYACDKMGILHD